MEVSSSAPVSATSQTHIGLDPVEDTTTCETSPATNPNVMTIVNLVVLLLPSDRNSPPFSEFAFLACHYLNL